MDTLSNESHLGNTNPEWEVLHPMNGYKFSGQDKVGAYLLFNNNRSWWCGSIMDPVDSNALCNGRFSPTVL